MNAGELWLEDEDFNKAIVCFKAAEREKLNSANKPPLLSSPRGGAKPVSTLAVDDSDTVKGQRARRRAAPDLERVTETRETRDASLPDSADAVDQVDPADPTPSELAHVNVRGLSRPGGGAMKLASAAARAKALQKSAAQLAAAARPGRPGRPSRPVLAEDVRELAHSRAKAARKQQLAKTQDPDRVERPALVVEPAIAVEPIHTLSDPPVHRTRPTSTRLMAARAAAAPRMDPPTAANPLDDDDDTLAQQGLVRSLLR